LVQNITRYNKTREKLRELVRKGEVWPQSSQEHINEYACYFCFEHIEGKAKVLRESYEQHIRKQGPEHPICDKCSERAKKYVYINNVPYSLN